MSFFAKNRQLILLAGLAGATLLGSTIFLLRSTDSALQQRTAPISPHSAPLAADRTAPALAPSQSTQTTAAPGDQMQTSIEKLYDRLASGEASDANLEALRRELLAGDPQRATAAIRAFLESGRDIPTSQEFTVGEGGMLAGAPTMRTFLLDLLGQVSKKTHSDAAAVVSRQILESKQSPDEWAVALRNVAWQDPNARTYLASKVREMLAYEPWTSQPSAGFIEAFDVAVYSQDPTFVPNLARLLRSDSPELQRASAVALDRLSAMAPLEVMTYLNSHPSELSDRPFMRADYYAKADLSNAAQRQALETYLARADVSVPEKTKLLKALTTPATFVSENLLTPAAPPDTDDSPVRDQQLNQTLAQWLKQNRYPELQGEMVEVQQRIGR